jgi:fatty acid desaturase
MAATPQERPEHLALQETDLAMGTAQLPGRDVLERDTLRALNVRSNCRGLLHFAGHLAAIAITGLLVHLAYAQAHWLWLIPAMVLHGFALVTLFAPMHECVHRTPFRSKWLNRGVGWLTGFGAFINSDYYYRYHHWHHRFTQDPDNDPELATPPPRTVAAYAWGISGMPYWYGKIQDMFTVSLGRVSHLPFIPAHGRRLVIWSMRVQAALYVLIILGSVLLNSDVLLIYWLLPLLLGQPLLRSITIAEHTHCSENANGLTNTRTTLTSWPVRFFMWNMPYHAEHHLYPSIPFHALPRAHDHIRERIVHLDNGYVAVNRAIVANLTQASN